MGYRTRISRNDIPTAITVLVHEFGHQFSNRHTNYGCNSNNACSRYEPGQAFFVKSKLGGGLVDFTASMRRTGNSDDFILGINAQTINVALSRLNLNSSSNNIYFLDGATRGLDDGSYQGIAGEFSIFTNLIEDNEGLDIAIQSLPYNDFNDIIVPLGVKAVADGNMIISLDDTSSLPQSVNVYLEDTELNTLTLLNNQDYIFTSTNNLVGIGRFFLRYSADTLSTVTSGLDNMLIYTDYATDNIVIKGQLTNNSSYMLYDIHGRVILSNALNSSNTVHKINVNPLSTGIYMLKLSNGNTTKTQKLVIR